MGGSLSCGRCGKAVEEDQAYGHLGKSYCEDCYMEVLSPTKACDPWAVYTSRSTLKGKDRLSELTPLQRSIVDFVSARGEVTAKELTDGLGLTEEDFKREFAVLRHMEVLKGVKKGPTVVFALFDSAACG